MFSFLDDTELYGGNLAGEGGAPRNAARSHVQVVGATAPPKGPAPEPKPPPQPAPFTLQHYEALLRALSALERRVIAADERNAQLAERVNAPPSGGICWGAVLACAGVALLALWILRLPGRTMYAPPAPLTSGVYLQHPGGGPPTPILLAAAPTSFLRPNV